MRRLILGCALVALAGCSHRAPIDVAGNWELDHAGSDPMANKLWRTAVIRFKEDGTFDVYADFLGRGTYRVDGNQIRLDFQWPPQRSMGFSDSQARAISGMDHFWSDFRATGRLYYVSATGFVSGDHSLGTAARWRRMAPLTVQQLVQMQSPSRRDFVRIPFAWDELTPMKPRDVPAVIKILQTDPDKEMRSHAAVDLHGVKSEDAVDALIKALSDPAFLVRVMALRSLVLTGSPKAEPAIVTAAGRSKYLADRMLWARELGELGDRRAMPVLISWLKDAPKVPPSKQPKKWYLRGNPEAINEIEAVGLCGDKSALPAIEPLIRNEDPEIQSAAIVAAVRLDHGRINDPATLDAVMGLASRMGRSQVQAIKILGLSQGGPKVLSLLNDALARGDESIVSAAITALGQLKDRSCIPRLNQILSSDDYSDSVKGAARKALEEIGS